MKHISLFIFISLYLTSCNSYLGKKLSKQTSKDINVEKIESICDCVDAYQIITNELLDVVGSLDKESYEKLSEERKKSIEEKIDPIQEKGGEVERHCKRNFGFGDRDLSAGSNCKSYDKALKAQKKLEEKF